jgi:hypothetical protein
MPPQVEKVKVSVPSETLPVVVPAKPPDSSVVDVGAVKTERASPVVSCQVPTSAFACGSGVGAGDGAGVGVAVGAVGVGVGIAVGAGVGFGEEMTTRM